MITSFMFCLKSLWTSHQKNLFKNNLGLNILIIKLLPGWFIGPFTSLKNIIYCQFWNMSFLWWRADLVKWALKISVSISAFKGLLNPPFVWTFYYFLVRTLANSSWFLSPIHQSWVRCRTVGRAKLRWRFTHTPTLSMLWEHNCIFRSKTSHILNVEVFYQSILMTIQLSI